MYHALKVSIDHFNYMNEKSMDRTEIINKMQEEVRLLQDALEKYKSEFDAETLKPISEQLSALAQNILKIDKELQMLKHLADKKEQI